MMSKFVVFDDIVTNVPIGAKAKNLAKLKRNGYLVPDYFVITSRYLDQYLEQNNKQINSLLKEIDFDKIETINEASKQIQKIIYDIQIDDSLKSEINSILNIHFPKVKTFSVRSSASIEDLSFASFAGQFDTVLNVPVNDIENQIIKCWASLYSPNVLKYCFEKNINIISNCLQMSVIIQEMIDAEFSAVGFSVNPIQKILNEMVVVVGEGIGEKLAQGLELVTTYYRNVTDNQSYYEQQNSAPVLDGKAIENIFTILNKCTKDFGPYIDMEFAIKKGEIYILQVREITTIDDSRVTVLDNSNIVESYPGVTLPLTESFAKQAYYGAFRGQLIRSTGSEKIVKRFDFILKHMVNSVNGRMYYQINNWYTLMRSMPFGNKFVPIWQDMLGVNNRATSVDQKLNIPIYFKIKIYVRSAIQVFSLPSKMRSLNLEFASIRKYFNSRYRDGLSNRELFALYCSLKNKVLKNWDLTLSNDVDAFVSTSILEKIYKSSGNTQYKMAVNENISHISQIESMKPICALIDIVKKIDDDQINELRRMQTNSDVREYLKSQNNHISIAIKDYIEEYGDRAVEELKLESNTFRTSPHLLIKNIIEYFDNPNEISRISHSFCYEKTVNNKQTALRFNSILIKYLAKYFSRRALRAIKNREISRFNRSRIFGMVRTIFLTIATNLKREDMLNDINDIFYLSIDEVDLLIKKKLPNAKEIISNRKQLYDMYCRLPMYSRLVFAGKPVNKQHKSIDNYEKNHHKGLLCGTACSSGVVEGEILIIDDPRNLELARGKIIVTKTTDPGWVFLLTICRGVIAEKGSLLSHTAIISRELGITSVVGVSNATKILKNGDKVRLNGETGEIQII